MVWHVKKDNLMLFKAFSINLNAQHVNGMTHFDLAFKVEKMVNICRVIRYSRIRR